MPFEEVGFEGEGGVVGAGLGLEFRGFFDWADQLVMRRTMRRAGWEGVQSVGRTYALDGGVLGRELACGRHCRDGDWAEVVVLVL